MRDGISTKVTKTMRNGTSTNAKVPTVHLKLAAVPTNNLKLTAVIFNKPKTNTAAPCS